MILRNHWKILLLGRARYPITKEKIMKSLLCFLFLASFYGHTLMAADEANNPETKTDSDTISSAKKVLKKVGRKARDTSCDWTEDKAKCEIEKSEHAKANAADILDSKKRKMEQATKEYENELKKTETK